MADTDPSARVAEGPKAAGALTDLRLLPLLAHFLRSESSAAWSVCDFLLGPDSPPAYGTDLTLSLTREQAKAMQHEPHAYAEAWRTVSLRNRREGAGEPTRDILFGTGMAPE